MENEKEDSNSNVSELVKSQGWVFEEAYKVQVFIAKGGKTTAVAQAKIDKANKENVLFEILLQI